MSIILVLFTLCIWCTDKLNGWHANRYLRIIKKYFLLYSLENNTLSLHKMLEVSCVEVSNVKLPCQEFKTQCRSVSVSYDLIECEK